MKKCIKCKEVKSLTEFSRDVRCKDGFRNDCKECKNADRRRYHAEHREEIGDYNKRYHTEHREEIRARKKRYRVEHREKCNENREKHRARRMAAVHEMAGYYCQRCGEAIGKHFHHIDPTTKEFDIGNGDSTTIVKLWKELDKCILVCINCHRKLHEEIEEG